MPDGSQSPAPAAPAIPDVFARFHNEATRSDDMTESEMMEAINFCRGNIAAICRVVSRNRLGVVNFINTHPQCVALLDEHRQSVLDKAEENFAMAVDKGDLEASRFVLTTLGKDRGYSTRVESTGKDGAELQPTTIVYECYAEEVAEVIEHEPPKLLEKVASNDRSAG